MTKPTDKKKAAPAKITASRRVSAPKIGPARRKPAQEELFLLGDIKRDVQVTDQQPKFKSTEIKAKPGVPPKGYEQPTWKETVRDTTSIVGAFARAAGTKAIDATKKFVNDNPAVAVAVAEVAVRVLLHPKTGVAINLGRKIFGVFKPK